jgi:hypothetical protein
VDKNYKRFFRRTSEADKKMAYRPLTKLKIINTRGEG